MAHLRLWKRGDLDFVADSVDREGWRHLKRDVERCWRFEPDGCFMAEVDGKRVGHVFSVCYGQVGWIGLLIVNPESRGRGIGAALMQRAIDYLRERGVETIRLEAVEKAVPLYRRLGFGEEFLSLRFSRRLRLGQKELRSLGGGDKSNISDVKEGDIDQLASFDSQYFGVSRLRVLRSLYQDEPGRNCFMARRGRGILGYVMSRRIRDGFWVGPWVCDNSETAEVLLRTCVDAVGREGLVELRLGMPDSNKAGVGLMGKFGFELVGRSLRMVWGKRKYEGLVSGVYGIGGAEKG